ncbi:gamma-glutamyltransferase family protein [Jiulongibacter sediminis]|uniref:Gamma-glutamyltransferase n=1 Tax=Jiulongibacter sediminis TaxID=1605367 RepID=A0A0P7BSB2_9BACT|nr:gamma-glutamyltransferase [Jiulongibacter sediminis]KPM47331.1 gamma-glutamyltransferase [Jiulongibacter sediminis]TBX22888.1 gamma-glutamyltransferase [Jiulongibacter sediminis]
MTRIFILCLLSSMSMAQTFNTFPFKTQKPPLHGKHWMALTGKPLAATAGALTFGKGGNAVDAACAMLAATSTMWDVLSWGGETQALIYNPKTKKVIAVNALGVAPTGATADYYKAKGYDYPPEYGPLSAVTPGTPGGLMVVLAEYGKLSLAEVLAPALQMAKDGYPIEAQTANMIESYKDEILKYPSSTKVFLTHLGEDREAPEAGEIFVQKDLANTLQKLIDTEQAALKSGKSRKEAIYAAYDRFYNGDIAEEIARSTQAAGGLITKKDLANWEVKLEEPMSTTYCDYEVFKLQPWTQGPVMLQTLNILENFDLKAMGYNSTNYIHALYQSMNLAYADRDFYYGDPAFPPAEPMEGLLSKDYAKKRLQEINFEKNDPAIAPGDPYPFENKSNPYLDLLAKWPSLGANSKQSYEEFMEDFTAGTTSVVTADEEGWVVSMTPSGGWVPAFIAGETGIGLSQRMQSFVLNEVENPFNLPEAGKRPRVTLTPSMALKDGKPVLAFAKQAGDEQDQLLLQFFLNVVEFGMTVQEAVEAPSFKTLQMFSSFGKHEKIPGGMILNSSTPEWTVSELRAKGYKINFQPRTSGPINSIFIDWKHGSFWGGSSNHGEDYGLGW